MKRKAWLPAGIALILLAAAWLLWRPGSTPNGQPPLVAIAADNFQQLQQEFNRYVDRPRVVLLLSPT
jgi:hypothetical protein